MKVYMLIIVVVLSFAASIIADDMEERRYTTERSVRFAPLEIYIDSGEQSLAAFQFELTTVKGEVKIVGIEGGEHAAFEQPPYYDPAALADDRVIIAAFDTGSDLPKGRTRVATVHLQILGDTEPEYSLELTVSASEEVGQIPAHITFEKGQTK